MNPEQLKEMNEIEWWHTMELDGVMTKGRDNSIAKLRWIQMPKDLTGRKVIDIGAWDGFFSFEAERRNAKSVLAIDTIMWKEHKTFNVQKNRETIHTGKRGFNFAHKILNSKVESKEIEIMDLSKENVGENDLILCLGILYHMQDPLGMCKVMYDICADEGLLILESHYDLGDLKDENSQPNKYGKPAFIPAMRFYPNNECNNDPGTWWGPNPLCIIEMLKVAGFNEIKGVHLETNRVVYHARKNG